MKDKRTLNLSNLSVVNKYSTEGLWKIAMISKSNRLYKLDFAFGGRQNKYSRAIYVSLTI